MNIGKSIPYTIKPEYIGCDLGNSSSSLKIVWYVNTIVQNSSLASLTNKKLIEYEQVLNGYCMKSDPVEQIDFKSRELSSGNYTLKVFAFDENYPEEFIMITIRLSVGMSPLVVTMNNPLNIELNWDETMQLDFIKNSYDPDQASAASDGLMFELVCLHANNTIQQTLLLNSIEQQFRAYNYDAQGFNLIYESGQLRIFEKNCFKYNINDTVLINFDQTTGLVSVAAESILLNSSDISPIVLQVFVHKDTRMSASSLVLLSLNMSSLFVITPSFNLNEMSSQLDMVDNLVNTDPKRALGLLGTFADAINNRPSSQNATTTTKAAIIDENAQLSNVNFFFSLIHL